MELLETEHKESSDIIKFFFISLWIHDMMTSLGDGGKWKDISD